MKNTFTESRVLPDFAGYGDCVHKSCFPILSLRQREDANLLDQRRALISQFPVSIRQAPHFVGMVFESDPVFPCDSNGIFVAGYAPLLDVHNGIGTLRLAAL